jgi:hypothetical protein
VNEEEEEEEEEDKGYHVVSFQSRNESKIEYYQPLTATSSQSTLTPP